MKVERMDKRQYGAWPEDNVQLELHDCDHNGVWKFLVLRDIGTPQEADWVTEFEVKLPLPVVVFRRDAQRWTSALWEVYQAGEDRGAKRE